MDLTLEVGTMKAGKIVKVLGALLLASVLFAAAQFVLQEPKPDYESFRETEVIREGDLGSTPLLTATTLEYQKVGGKNVVVKNGKDGADFNTFYPLVRRSDGITIVIKEAPYCRQLLWMKIKVAGMNKHYYVFTQ